MLSVGCIRVHRLYVFGPAELHRASSVCSVPPTNTASVLLLQVERFVFRPGLSDRGRYYAVTFLNQIPMSNRPQVC